MPLVPTVSPFDGLLFDPAVVGDVGAATAPPYDVILADELSRFQQASPHSITRVDLTFRDGESTTPDQYTRAGRILRGWIDEGALAPVGRPVFFVQEMRFSYRGEERAIRGVIAEVELHPWGGPIIPHERTMPGPIEDRLSLMRTTHANVSPIYSVVAGPAAPQTELIGRAVVREPDLEVLDERGVLHRLWVEDDSPALSAWYAEQTLLIADGHHRYQTALHYREEMHESHGPGPWDSVMMLLVDATTEDPPILPIHRVVSTGSLPELPGHLVRDLGEVLATLVEDDLRFGAAFMRDGDLHHLIGRLEGEPPTVRALHTNLLDDLPDVKEVRFVPDAVVAEDAVRHGDAQLALFLPPARVANVRAVIDRGERLPQKSTYFWPKARTGLVVRPL